MARRLLKVGPAAETVASPVVALKRKGVTWTEPLVASEIAFRAWTDDGMLRHASFKGVREDADKIEIYRLN